jgi:cobalamin-dependent methionine synthase I
MEVHFSPAELEEAIKYIDWRKVARTLDPALPYRQEDERRQQQKTDNLRHHAKEKLKKALRRGF